MKVLLILFLSLPAFSQDMIQMGVTPGAIDTAKLATDSVTTVKILNGAVDTAKIAADAVGPTQLLSSESSCAKISGGDFTCSNGSLVVKAHTIGDFANPSILGAGGTVGMDINSSVLGFVGTSNRFIYTAPGVWRMASDMNFAWIDGANTYGAYNVDTNLSRLSAGKLGVGTGAAASIAGTLVAGNIGIGTSFPATTIDVVGNAQFGSGATKSTFTATGFWEPISKTRAQIDVLVPTKVGQVIYASDTTLPGLCVSTGTAAAQWRKMESASLGCGTNN